VRSLCFLARRFEWAPFERTLPDAGEAPPSGAVEHALVAFLHVEARDVADTADAVRKTIKHLKWIANKRDVKEIVLHSFTHLGGESAEPALALAFLGAVRERLESTGYRVSITPFGWFSSWTLDVYGESLAKVYKEL
jgi:hypothetical protein